MKYLKLFEDEYQILNGDDIEIIEDLFQEYIDKWKLKKIEKPIYSYWFNNPEEKVYRIRHLPFIDMPIEISIGYIVYDGVYEINEEPLNDFRLFSNRLKNFGYDVGPIKQEWCDTGYTSEYVNPENHTDLKPECEYRTIVINGKHNNKRINESINNNISLEDTILFVYYFSYTRLEILKRLGYKSIFNRANLNEEDFVISTEDERKKIINNDCIVLNKRINKDIILKEMFLNFMSEYKKYINGYPNILEIEDIIIGIIEENPGLEYDFVIDDTKSYLALNIRCDGFLFKKLGKSFFELIGHRIFLLFGNMCDSRVQVNKYDTSLPKNPIEILIFKK